MPPNVSIHNDTFEKRKTATKPQLSEAFKFTFDLDPEDPDFGKNRRFRGHNKWPDEIVVPGLKKSFMEFHIAFENQWGTYGSNARSSICQTVFFLETLADEMHFLIAS